MEKAKKIKNIQLLLFLSLRLEGEEILTYQ